MKKIIYIIAFFVILTTSYSQWELLKGPGSNKTITSVDVEGNDIYITILNTIFKSTDLGESWQQLNNQSEILFNKIKNICKFKNLLFVYTNYSSKDQNRGIYFSSDDGKTWNKINEGIKNVNFLSEFYQNADNLYSVFNDDIYKFNTNIHKWQRDFRLDTAHLSFNTIIEYNDYVFVGCEQVENLIKLKLPNLFRYSQNNGKIEAIRDTVSGLWQYAIKSFVAKGNKLFAGTTGGLFVSTNEGVSWTKKNNGLRYEDSTTSYDLGINDLCVKGDYMYAIARGNIAYSSDEGESWQFPDPYKIINGNWLPSLGAYSISVVDNKLLINLGKEGLYITSNDTLTDLQSIVEKEVFCGDMIRDYATNGEKIYAAIGYGYDSGNSGVWESSNDGNTWNRLLFNDFSKIAVKDSFIIVGDGFYNKNPYYSTDGGKTFNKITVSQGLEKLQILSIKIFGDTIYVGTKSGIYFSSDWGQLWNLLSVNLIGSPIYSIECYGNYIFAGTDNNTIMISSDNGATWSQSFLDVDKYKLTINSIKAIYKSFDLDLYVGTVYYPPLNTNNVLEEIQGRGVFFSKDSGKSWTEVNMGLPNYLGVTSIERAGALTFLSMNRFGGVYYSSSVAGYYDIWYPYNKGLTNSNIYKLISTDKYLFAGTDGGMYRLKLSDVGILDVNDYAIERKNYFYAYPPYPLPAGEIVQARIFWDLGLDINTAEIKVYDIYGKEISDGKDLAIVPESGWSGTLIWNCKGVTPGVYLITIKYGTERRVIKVVKG